MLLYNLDPYVDGLELESWPRVQLTLLLLSQLSPGLSDKFCDNAASLEADSDSHSLHHSTMLKEGILRCVKKATRLHENEMGITIKTYLF
jgi:hypothetical protein